MASTPTDLQLLELDIELRLHSVLGHAFDLDVAEASVIALLRMAYGTGYLDALREPRRGQLCRDHGLAVPSRDVVATRKARSSKQNRDSRS